MGFYIPISSIWLCVLFCLGPNIDLAAQESDSLNYKLLYTIPKSTPLFATDRLQQLYYLDASNQINKTNNQGQALFQYSNRSLGTPQSIDAFDPFEVMVFYQDFGTILILDRTLNELFRLNLQDFGYFGIEAIARANDNNFWIFNPFSFQLEKIDAKGNRILNSRVLNNILPESPKRIIEKDQFLYVQVPNYGLYIFDNFGQFVSKVPSVTDREFQVAGNQVFYFKDQQLYLFQLDLFQESRIQLPKQINKPIISFSLSGQQLFLGTADEISVFELQTN